MTERDLERINEWLVSRRDLRTFIHELGVMREPAVLALLLRMVNGKVA